MRAIPLTNNEMQYVLTKSSPTPVKGSKLQQALEDFRLDSAEWKDEVTSFFGDLDGFLLAQLQPAAAASHKLEADVAALRSRVEQQTEVLSALVDTLVGETPSPAIALPTAEDTDEVVEAFFGRVEQLQNVATETEAGSM